MTAESYWTDRLRTFSLVDFSLVKLVYFLSGLWVLTIYPALGRLDWWFCLTLSALCALPVVTHWAIAGGGPIRKSREFVASNTPALQVLLFLCQFFAAITLGILVPALASGPWWFLLAIIAVAAIKPMTKTLLW